MTFLKRLPILLCLIVALGFLARVWSFPAVPAELNRDEAALGYNAFSLLNSGKDEWGVSFPIVFRSFGDYKLPGYIYTLVPFVATLGLTPLAVRLPSLLAGVALVSLMYMLVIALTKSKRIGYAAAFTLAISPWAIHYSRVGFEANLALAFLIAGIIPLLPQKVSWRGFVCSLICFFVSFVTYNASLIFFPFLLGIFLVTRGISYKDHAFGGAMLTRSDSYIQSFFLFLVGLTAFILVLPATQGKSMITIFSDQNLGEMRRAGRLQDSSVIGRVRYSPLIFYLPMLEKNYFATFSPSFLVTRGGENPWHQPTGASHFTWPLYLTALFGMLVLVFGKTRGKYTALAMLAFSPIASGITTDAPHATRSLFFFFMLALCAGVGLERMFQYKKILGLTALGALLVGFFVYMRIYLLYFPAHPQREWNIGISSAIRQAEEMRKDGETIVLVGDIHYSYIYPLFVLRQNPEELQKTRQVYPKDVLGFTPVKSFSHYLFVETPEQTPANSIVVVQKDPLAFTVARADSYGKITP